MKIGDKIKCIKESTAPFTVGKVYTVTELDYEGDPVLCNDDGYEDAYYAHYFEVVDYSQYDLGNIKELIGKNVLHNGKKFKVEAFTVFNKYYPTDNKTIQEEVKKKGYSIVLENDDGYVPISEIEEISNKVVLSDEYTAIIDGDNVKVGCQNIPIQKVEEILETHKKLMKH